MPNRRKPLVVVTRRLPDVVETRMRELFDAKLNLDDKPLDPAELAEAVRTADVLVPTITDEIDASVLAQAGPNLKLIANFGNGVDNIDVQAALARGITVTNTPGVLTEDTADMTMALILAVGAPHRRRGARDPRRRLGRLVADLDARATGSPASASASSAWAASARRWRGAARRSACRSTTTTAAACPPRVEEELEATYWESLDQMLARMDIVSVNCPHTPATYHLLSARRLKLLKPEAIVVNTARGEIIDETALARLIEAGEIAGAGLDVFEHEPAVNPRLIKLARAGKVVLLPHLASNTYEGRVDMGEKVIVNIKTFMDGHRPPDRVLPSML